MMLPSRLLFAAFQGIAEASAFSRSPAIPLTGRPLINRTPIWHSMTSYDDLFAELGLPRDETGLFSSSLPLAHKPLASIKRTHRHRARKKRAFSQQFSRLRRFFPRLQHQGERRSCRTIQQGSRVIRGPRRTNRADTTSRLPAPSAEPIPAHHPGPARVIIA